MLVQAIFTSNSLIAQTETKHMNTPKELIKETEEFFLIAEDVQSENLDDQTRQERLRQLLTLYRTWYHKALGIFVDFNRLDLQNLFMQEYEGGNFSSKIKKFLDLGWKRFDYYNPEKPNPIIPKWTTTYSISFKSPLEKQCDLLAALGEPNNIKNLNPHNKIQQSAMASLRQEVSRVEIHKFVIQKINDDELRTLCFYLNIDYDSLLGEGKDGKTRELIIKLEKEGKLPDLYVAIEDLHRN